VETGRVPLLSLPSMPRTMSWHRKGVVCDQANIRPTTFGGLHTMRAFLRRALLGKPAAPRDRHGTSPSLRWKDPCVLRSSAPSGAPHDDCGLATHGFAPWAIV